MRSKSYRREDHNSTPTWLGVGGGVVEGMKEKRKRLASQAVQLVVNLSSHGIHNVLSLTVMLAPGSL